MDRRLSSEGLNSMAWKLGMLELKHAGCKLAKMKGI